MINFPSAKINIGLQILSKRDDGFHNISTFFYPVDMQDILEIVETSAGSSSITVTGMTVEGNAKDNLCMKAYHLLTRDFSLPAVEIHLHKCIHSGAGLGGGSSDAASTLKMLRSMFELNISDDKLKSYASRLGSDCAFFIDNTPAFASSRGEVLEKTTFRLTGKRIEVVVPEIKISTAEAYSNIVPNDKVPELKSLVFQDISEWRHSIVNDFEPFVFKKHPEIALLKNDFYERGALYASLSGSGSAVFGIFTSEP